MKKNKLLNSKIKKMHGNVLAIGITDETLLNTIDNNEDILECNILSDSYLTHNKNGINSKMKGKRFHLSRLRKKFKKKKVDYLICDLKKAEDYKTFIKDSIYITKEEIVFCTNNKELIKKKYSRYDVRIEEINCTDQDILIINAKNAKNNWIKELYYDLIDGIMKVIDMITNLLLS